MKVQLLSDLHLEFYKDPHAFIDTLPRTDAEVLILAGDILVLSRYELDEIKEIFKHFASRAKHLLYLPGNHEFYGQSVADSLKRLKEIESCVHLIEPTEKGIWEKNGIRILGGTLWFPYDADNPQFEHYLSDFSQIIRFKEWVYAEHDRCDRFLHGNVRPGDIVVTHHLPGMESVAAKWKASELNRFFVNDCAEIISTKTPSFWFHGHTHNACDYVTGKTRVICNPAGYPKEKSGWNPGLVIDV